MRIKIENTWLSEGGLEGPAGLSLNGQQIVDDVAFFRAAARTFFARGGAAVSLQFSVTRTFNSVRLAEKFLLTHFTSIPLAGIVQCVCGIQGDEETLYLADAVIEAVALPSQRGECVIAQYTIKGGAFTSDVPGDLPGEPDDGEGFIVLRRGSVAIGTGDTSVDVVFSSPLSAVPVVMCTISRPAAGDAIWAMVNEDTITVDGFTAELSGAPADGTFRLKYIAIE